MVGDLVRHLSGQDKALTCSSASHCKSPYGQIRFQLASTSRKSRTHGASRIPLSKAVLCPLLTFIYRSESRHTGSDLHLHYSPPPLRFCESFCPMMRRLHLISGEVIAWHGMTSAFGTSRLLSPDKNRSNFYYIQAYELRSGRKSERA